MKIEFKTSGVCCRKITLEVDENNIIQELTLKVDVMEILAE